MARPSKQTVEWFPHSCNHKRTMFILEQKYGNNGYCFWFKLLEILGGSDGHYFDASTVENREYLQARMHLSWDICLEILELLSRLEAIDKNLWECNQVVWCQNFVDGISEVYKKRIAEAPQKPSFRTGNPPVDEFPHRKPSNNGVSDTGNPQRERVEEVEELERGEEVEETRKPLPLSEITHAWNTTCGDILPSVSKLTRGRKDKLTVRLDETQRYTLDWWRSYFERIRASSFCCGDNDRGWRADFDWAIRSEDVICKVFEGRYDNRASPSRELRGVLKWAEKEGVFSDQEGVCHDNGPFNGSHQN